MTKTKAINPFKSGLALRISVIWPWISQAPEPTSAQTSSIWVMARIGWLNVAPTVVPTVVPMGSDWDMSSFCSCLGAS
jgi:hypothetical protein